MTRIELLRPRLDLLEAEWRDLEARAAGSVFQSWTWVGCCAEIRFPRPALLRVSDAGQVIGLALFNERGRGLSTLWLGESGDPALDRVFVEYNGMLMASGRDSILPAALHAAMRSPLAGSWGRRRLVLSGIEAATLAAARRSGVVRVRQTRTAPFVDLTKVGPEGTGILDRLSRNTRQQLRRSDRLYGAVRVRPAESLAEAEAFLAGLITLHLRRWAARARESSLSDPGVIRFLQTLLRRGHARGEVELLRVDGGEELVGYLLNLRRGGWIGQYQGGFDYENAGPHRKPGLTCHHAAILHYQAQGATRYDFLAGDDRYKTSLADDATPLHWIELAPRLSLHNVLIRPLRYALRY